MFRPVKEKRNSTRLLQWIAISPPEVLNQDFRIPNEAEIAAQRAEETAILAAVHQNVGRGEGSGRGNRILPATNITGTF